MRIYVKYEKGFIHFMFFYCITIVGTVVGVWMLMPYVIQSISAPNGEILGAIYNFGGWINRIDRGFSLVLVIWYSIWIMMMHEGYFCNEDYFFCVWGDTLIWCVYRILIAIVKTFMKYRSQNALGFWIIVGVEIIIFLVPFIVTFIVWRIGRKKAIKQYKQQIASCGINKI